MLESLLHIIIFDSSLLYVISIDIGPSDFPWENKKSEDPAAIEDGAGLDPPGKAEKREEDYCVSSLI